MMQAHVRIIKRKELCLADARAVSHLTMLTWPGATDSLDQRAESLLQRSARAPEDELVFLVEHDGSAYATAMIITRQIQIENNSMQVLGLAGVCSHPDVRGKGFGRLVIEAAFKTVKESGGILLFQCNETVRPLYEKLGAVVVHNRFMNSHADAPNENPLWDPFAMIYPADITWPAGVVDLCGRAW